jgi:alpha-beta hydrolase superfamily lysophospholipase
MIFEHTFPFCIRQPELGRAALRHLADAALALALGVAGLSASTPVAAADPAAATAVDPAHSRLISSAVHPVPPDLRGDGRLLVHTMPSIKGEPTPASTLLFVPQGTAPAGGWPVIAWAHGTTTPGQKTCAPSLTPEHLDGGLTRDGFKSDYAFQISQFVNAGYAVVAADLEGLGPVATVPHPYFGEASFARSLIAGVQAARQAESALSNRIAAVGHSEGGHGALSVDAHVSEAPELTLVGIVASAPNTSVAALARIYGERARTLTGKVAEEALVNEAHRVMLMTVGLSAKSPDYNAGEVMGKDLRQVLPKFRASCSVPSFLLIGDAIRAGDPTFEGVKPGWADTPQMRAFLQANDPAVTPGFTLKRPTLIVQGTLDPLVLEPLTTKFVAKLKAKGAPVTYRKYPGADHFTVIRRANADVLDFLKTRFKQ